MKSVWKTIEEGQGFLVRLFRWSVYALGAFFGFQLVSLYLSWPKQLVLGLLTILVALILGRVSKSYLITLALMIMSMVATVRYGWWRIRLVVDFFSDSSNRRFQIDSLFLLILLSAEVYAFAIMFLGYLQMAWPLHRKPLPLPDDINKWPHVDLLIPTYNEPLSIVRYTALAAMGIDYPPDKLHVYILDDGRRDDFRDFALEAGVGYLRRTDNKGAKAGNINRALERLKSPFIAIFDCDHVPTRSFLQVTVGWFLKDSKLAMLQTPHHFYSPDPFERNLGNSQVVPNEGELFYGIVQDGNDFWNATFFCGSCAVLRRTALEQVGGVRTETVTEDAHTSLRLQMRGWNTAYINLPQAAGLATESLSAHIGQRIRWARGMIQILRTDNPLFARGLKFPQRICYFNAMFHFMYAVPRLVFLLAPLMYMLLGRSIIPGFWAAILAYALPHLVLSSMANSRIQGRHRHSFWNEIYETVLAPYILAPTLLALINPKLGKFNVTDKGGVVEDSYFDSHIARPTTFLLLLNLIGVAVAPYRMFIKDPLHPGTVILNLVWIVFNIIILGAAGAVALEAQQRRGTVRISAILPTTVVLADGTSISGHSIDMSAGGASIRVSETISLDPGEVVRVRFALPDGNSELRSTVVKGNGDLLRLEFQCPTIPEQEALTRVLYSRADAWIGSSAEEDRPLLSLCRIVAISSGGIKQLLLGLIPRRRPVKQSRPASTAAALLLVMALGLALPMRGQVARGQANREGPSTIAPPSETDERDTGTFRRTLTFKDIGILEPLQFSGAESYQTVHLTLPSSQVVTDAVLNVKYRLSAELAGQTGSLQVILNSAPVETIPISESGSAGGTLLSGSIHLPSELLVHSNNLTFQLSLPGLSAQQVSRPAAAFSIDPTSNLVLSGNLLPLAADLKMLPLPFYDKELETVSNISFVFLSQPSMKTLEAAGIVASWFGVQSAARPVKFSVSIGKIPAGNAILFSSNPSQLPDSLRAVSNGDPTISLQVNPADSYSKVLLIAGTSEDQLLTAARALALADKSLEGDTTHLSDFTMPEPRNPDDAPLWLPTDRLSPLWNYGAENELRGDGSAPLAVYLRVPPDLYYGETANLQLRLNYRYNGAPLLDRSALRIIVNGSQVNEAPLLHGPGMVEQSRRILFPVVDMRPSSNTFLFDFDFQTPFSGDRESAAKAKLAGEILRSSSLDVRGLVHWAAMPNLELFANAGFPFTRMADLSDTRVILPAKPSLGELSLFLMLMSHFAEQTGYPALRVTVSDPTGLGAKDVDYLIIGGIGDQPAIQSLRSSLPVTFDSDGVHLNNSGGFANWSASAWNKLVGYLPTNRTEPDVRGEADALVEGIESPYSTNRSIVIVQLKDDGVAERFSEAFLARSQSSDISASAALFRGVHFHSYRIQSNLYHVGTVSWYVAMRIWLAENFWVLLAGVTLISLLLAVWTRTWLRRHAERRLQLATH
jgi:cellulose synthase (UDP-forming)